MNTTKTIYFLAVKKNKKSAKIVSIANTVDKRQGRLIKSGWGMAKIWWVPKGILDKLSEHFNNNPEDILYVEIWDSFDGLLCSLKRDGIKQIPASPLPIGLSITPTIGPKTSKEIAGNRAGLRISANYLRSLFGVY